MKILHVALGLEIAGGGGNRAPAELCESLAGLGADVELLTLDHDDPACFVPEGVCLRRFRRDRWLSMLEYSSTLQAALHERIPTVDILHLHSMWRWPNIAAAGIARRAGVPYVVQPHGSVDLWRLKHKRLQKWIWGSLFERRVLRGAAFIHVESEYDRTGVIQYVPGVNTVVNPCGAFEESFQSRPPKDYLTATWPQLAGKKCLLFLSRIDVMKGLDLLLGAFASIAADRDDLALLIVGNDHAGLVPDLKTYCRCKGIADRVVWAGPIWGEERFWAMKQCDVYVHPSKSDNFGISVLEAMFCGAPILTTTGTPWQELADEGAGIVVEPSAESIGLGLRNMLDLSAAGRAALGTNARALALRKYEWEPIARDLIKHYETAIAANCRRRAA